MPGLLAASSRINRKVEWGDHPDIPRTWGDDNLAAASIGVPWPPNTPRNHRPLDLITNGLDATAE